MRNFDIVVTTCSEYNGTYVPCGSIYRTNKFHIDRRYLETYIKLKIEMPAYKYIDDIAIFAEYTSTNDDPLRLVAKQNGYIESKIYDLQEVTNCFVKSIDINEVGNINDVNIYIRSSKDNERLDIWNSWREVKLNKDLNVTIYEAQNKWQGWGTALKPSFEPIIVARKPFKGSLVDNVIEYGVGGINIDECRVAFIGNENTLRPLGKSCYQKGNKIVNGGEITGNHELYSEIGGNADKGRFPTNTILTYDETDFDEVCGGFPNTKSTPRTPTIGGTGGIGQSTNFQRGSETSPYNDSGFASRYFYCAKASKKDRDCDGTIKNIHPCIKPCNLMEYLIRLVTPNNGTVLDPFNGSGSTGKAVMYENKERNKNYKYIGIELTEEYLPISKARIEYVCNLIEEDATKDKQMTIFDVGGVNEEN